MSQNAKKLNMLSGPIWSRLPQFALPVAATAILEQLFNASDIAVVGNFTGEIRNAAVAAVGANSPIISLILNLFIGIALGANVVIANAIGRSDREAAQQTVNTAIVFSLVGGLLVGLLGEGVASGLLHLIQVPEDVFPLALLYLRIYLAGMPVILLFNFEAAIFRSIGDTKTPLAALAFSGILNVILNLFFVIVLKMTVNGVATATVISNAVSSLILWFKLQKADPYVRLDVKSLRFHPKSFGRIVRIGLPAGVQSAVFSVANIVIQSAINSLGTVVMAASSAAYNIEVLAYDVLNAFSQACTTFVGQNYGAGNIRRCKKTLLLSLAEGAAATLLSVGLILLTGKSLLSVFNRDPQVIDTGYIRLVYLFCGYLGLMAYEVLSGYLRGFGISFVPALLTTIGVCGVRIAWISTAFPANPTFPTIMMAYPISLNFTALLLLVAVLIYRPARRRAHLERTEKCA